VDLTIPGRIQIAGVIDQAEADLIVAAGADALGFPLALKDGREDLSVENAAAIVQGIKNRATAVCITYLDNAREIIDLCHKLGAHWVQLHGPIETREIQQLKSMDGSLGIIKSLIVRPEAESELMCDVERFESYVDAFITDTYDPETGRSGATGITHNWAISREIVSAARTPVILAGGLTPGNVGDAIAAVRPAAVDAHTGVEGPAGRKDADLVAAFVQGAEQAFSTQLRKSGSYSAEIYNKRDFRGTDWLAFRDIPELLDRHLDATLRALPALDLGCGTGRSTRFLASLGLNVSGCDIDPDMLSIARGRQAHCEFTHLQAGSLPWPNEHFALVFTCFVLMEIASLDQMQEIAREIRRVLHPRGIAVLVVTTPEFYSGRWLSCDVDFPQNKGDLASGKQVRVRLVPQDIQIDDYFWSDVDYGSVFGAAGLSMREKLLPLGHRNDARPWIDELTTPPYAVYVLEKKSDHCQISDHLN